jgi:uncharacterized membrane protein YgaE (UPF0421/DUF939 family)
MSDFMKTKYEISLPFMAEISAILCIAESKKGQGSLEYIMMLAAASIVIVIALAMIVKLKGVAVTSIASNGTNVSVAQEISSQLSSLSKNVV